MYDSSIHAVPIIIPVAVNTCTHITRPPTFDIHQPLFAGLMLGNFILKPLFMVLNISPPSPVVMYKN